MAVAVRASLLIARVLGIDDNMIISSKLRAFEACLFWVAGWIVLL